MYSLRSHLVLSVWLLLVPLSATVAQPSPSPDKPTERAQLLERLRVADSLGQKTEAFVIRTRLRDGDFEVGDRIDVRYEGVTINRSDSLVVESGRVVRLGEPMGDLG